MYNRKPNTHCHSCNTPIYVRPGQLKDNPVRYCSHACYGPTQRIARYCVVCDAELAHGTAHSRKTCGDSCWKVLKGRNRNRVGTPEPVTNKALKKHIVRERGCTCEVCGFDKSDKLIELHHIWERKQGGPNESANVLLLCALCHGAWHHDPDYLLREHGYNVDKATSAVLSYYNTEGPPLAR